MPTAGFLRLPLSKRRCQTPRLAMSHCSDVARNLQKLSADGSWAVSFLLGDFLNKRLPEEPALIREMVSLTLMTDNRKPARRSKPNGY